jgi:16S rRNA (guanine(966)-N(2))-methyltransferase RsmD
MRVIAGSARGCNLKSPPRPRASGRPGIRPTSDLVLVVTDDTPATLGAFVVPVLELHAGSGALGIEALSRGDGTADFVEQDPDGIATVRANLALTGFDARAAVHQIPAALATSRLRSPYTLVLADPPYYDTDAIATVEAVASSALVGPDTVLVLEHHRRMQAPDTLGPLVLYRRRRHGDTVVSIYEQEAA